MSWSSTIPHVLAGLAILFVPGLLVLWASRVRGVAMVAVSAPVTVSIAAVAALVAPVLGLRWSLVPVAIVTVVVAVVALGVTRLALKNEAVNEPRRINWLAGAGHTVAILTAAFLIGRRLLAVFGTPESFSQTFDNVFHLNAVRYILDTGSGSSFTVSSMTGGTFYPSAWHDIVSLLAGVTGASVPVAVNVTNLIVGSVVWPLGCIFLAHTLLGNRVVVSVAAGVLSAAFGAFPLLLLDFGVLYPNFLGNALLPVALGLALQALGLGYQLPQSRTVVWLLFLAALPGLTLAHPSSMMALLALLLSPLLYLWFRTALRLWVRSPKRWLALAGMVAVLAAGLGALVVAWKAVRPVEAAATWQPFESTGRAIGEVITSSGIGRSVSWVVMILAVAGVVSLILRQKQLWLVGMYLVMASLFVVVASAEFGPVRTFFTGVWYNDPPRLASLLPLVTLPLAAVAAVRCWDKWIVPMVVGRPVITTIRPESRRAALRGFALVIVGAVVTGLLGFGTQQANVREAQSAATPGYRLTEDAPLVSPDELALIQRLPAEVPAGATMVGNPWNGSALAYAFSGRKLLQLHLLGEVPSDATKIFDGLNEANSDPTVCPVIRRLQIGYVLDFGHQEIRGWDHGYRGLDDLVTDGVAKLVDSEGQARLFKLTACGQ
ncbi:DUF6541 family protein [Arthrobacter sp. ES1]|uniref:DUF6541 family protein n=1 Tax=Arthrobacter sp. ES1 TaxID=1897056 RepID=UPI0028682223|nr:DUF6541 family protein [Arthrobacter sp. ES1]